MNLRWSIMAAVGLVAGFALGQHAEGPHPQSLHLVQQPATVTAVQPVTNQNPTNWPWKKYFATGQALAPVSGLKSGDEAFEVRDSAKQVLGWVFRTDRIAPVVRGRNAEIGAMVALAKDGKIAGVDVLENRETPAYFRRLTPVFFHQFVGHAVSLPPSGVDAVTGATLSSRAVIQDVFSSAAEVLKVVRPSVPAT